MAANVQWAKDLYKFIIQNFEETNPCKGEIVTADVRPHFNQLCEFIVDQEKHLKCIGFAIRYQDEFMGPSGRYGGGKFSKTPLVYQTRNKAESILKFKKTNVAKQINQLSYKDILHKLNNSVIVPVFVDDSGATS